jgi:leader peptidase (prepilin peptidase) / N-methyltransferase
LGQRPISPEADRQPLAEVESFMEFFLKVIYIILGLCVGSFVNMLVFRTARRYDLVKSLKSKSLKEQRSFCDFCGRQLKWYENIPVVSWVIQKGRTRCCDNPLPWEYPIIEIIMGVIFLLITNYELRITNYIIVTLLVFSTVFDLKYMILPDFSTYILIILAMFIGHNWLSGLGAGLFLLILFLVTKGKGMGLGDVKLAMFMGLFLGYPNIMVAFYLAFIIGAVVGVGLIGLKVRKRNQAIPFGPFLILGTTLAYFYGDKIMYYFSRWL